MLGCAREPPHPNIIPLNFLSNFQKSCLRAFGPLQCTEHRNSQRNFCLLIFQVVATAYICRYNIRNPARQHQSIASAQAQTVLCLLHASSTLTSFGRGWLWWCPFGHSLQFHQAMHCLMKFESQAGYHKVIVAICLSLVLTLLLQTVQIRQKRVHNETQPIKHQAQSIPIIIIIIIVVSHSIHIMVH